MPGPAQPSIIQRRRGLSWVYYLLIAIPVVVVAVATRSVGAVFFELLVLVVVPSVVIRLMLRRQARKRAEYLAESPAGTLFASYAGGFVPAMVEDARVSGILRIGLEGITFTAPVPGIVFPQIDLRWPDVERLEVWMETPFRAVMRVRTVTRRRLTWRVTGAHELERALEQVRDRF